MTTQAATQLKFDRDTAIEILDGDHDDFLTVEDELVDTRRWSLDYRLVVAQVTTGKYFEAFYSVGATEQQDESPWEYEKEVTFTEVRPVEKVITVYERF